MRSNSLMQLGALILGVAVTFTLKAQNTIDEAPPVINVYFFALESPPDSVPFCPNHPQDSV